MHRNKLARLKSLCGQKRFINMIQYKNVAMVDVKDLCSFHRSLPFTATYTIIPSSFGSLPSWQVQMFDVATLPVVGLFLSASNIRPPSFSPASFVLTFLLTVLHAGKELLFAGMGWTALNVHPLNTPLQSWCHLSRYSRQREIVGRRRNVRRNSQV